LFCPHVSARSSIFSRSNAGRQGPRNSKQGLIYGRQSK
jgi:hypothetical protein